MADTLPPVRVKHESPNGWVLAGVVAGAALLYVATQAPTLLWGDDAELQRIITTGEPRVIGQSSGASHLLWLAVARVFVPATGWLPMDAAGRATLLTALFAALATGAVYLAGAELGRALGISVRKAGLAAATALGLSHTWWLLAVRPDVYTLQMTLLAAAVAATLRWRRTGTLAWCAAAIVVTLAALANHAMILVSGPGLAVLALTVPRPRQVRLLAVAGGLAVLSVVALGAAALSGRTTGAVTQLGATLLAFRPVVPSLRDVVSVPLFLLYQFPLSILLALAGLREIWNRDRGALAGVTLLYVANVALPLSIKVADRFLFFLPSYLPVALLAGIGAVALVDRVPVLRRVRVGSAAVWAALAVPLVVYPLATIAGGAAAARIAPARHLPGRDPVTFYLWPPKTGYTGARLFGESALSTVAPRAAILADWLPYQTLRYLQRVEGRRDDVLLGNLNAGAGGAQLRFLLEQQSARRPLYLADNAPPPYYDIADIERCFSVVREGVVYRLTPRAASPAVSGCAP